MERSARILVCSVLLACSGSADTATPVASAERQQAVSFADAVATASAEVPDGVPYEVEMERLDGKDVIEVEFLVGAAVREVYIDPATGDVVSVRDEPPSHTEQSSEELETQAAMMGGAKVTLSEAADIAAGQSGGEALEVEFKVVEDQLVAEVHVQTEDGKAVVLVDAATGDVVDN